MTRFACPKVIISYILEGGIASLVLGLIAGLASLSILVGIILFFIISAWMAGLPLLIWRNAFARVTVDETGIRNKHIAYTWEEMEQYRIIDLNIAYGGIGMPFVRGDVLCFGEIPPDRSFTRLNPRKAVFIILDKKTKELLASFSNGHFLV